MAERIKIQIPHKDRQYIQDCAHRHPHAFVRRKALTVLLKHQDIPNEKITDIVGISGNTIRNYCKGYQEKGIEFIEAINFYKPQSQLKSFEQVVKDYLEKCPPASIEQACSEIKNITGVCLKATQMRAVIKKFGGGYRKVCGIPAKADIEKQRIFKEEQLEPRLQEAKENKRTVFFMDAAHFVLGAFLGYLWSLSRVFVSTPSGRQRFNVLGALNAVTKELLTVTNNTYITSIQVCELLRVIVESTTGPITIVLDNAKYQRCKLVMDLAAELGVELLFLPPYSPNLNLIERVWKFVKKTCLNSTYYPDFSTFKQAISTLIDTMHVTHENALQSLLTLNFQIFNEKQIKGAK